MFAFLKQKKKGDAPGDVTKNADACLGFNLLLTNTARAIAADKDFRIVKPSPAGLSVMPERPIRIGFCGNIANNHYIFAKCFRRLGVDAELLLDAGFIDTFVMNRPFWEDIALECASYEEGLAREADWTPPDFVRKVSYSPELQKKYAGRIGAIPEVRKLYSDAFGIELPEEKAFLLAQYMGHWPMISAMSRYDVIQCSSGAIHLMPFCPKPYVILPTGGDLRISPFEENMNGYLYRAAYRNAAGWIPSDSGFCHYLSRLGIVESDALPLLIDDDTYCIAEDPEIRQSLERSTGGERFILMACRQNWEWKGNHIFLESFARVQEQFPQWRLILSSWGPDIERSRALIETLGIGDKIHWLPLASKTRLRQYQNAADLIVDHCLTYGYGTTVLESLAAGKPVLMYTDLTLEAFFKTRLPMIGFQHVDQIPGLLETWLSDPEALRQRGLASRQWLSQVHGYRAVAPKYLNVFERALSLPEGTVLLQLNGEFAVSAPRKPVPV